MNGPTALFNLAVIAATVYSSYRGFNSPAYLDRYIFSPEHILRHKQYYRLVSSGFLHADWMHLLFNMYSLYSFGSIIELVFGAPTFLAIYFASILGGSGLSLYLHRKHDYRALGASGGVCGIIFACIFLVPGSSVQIFLLPINIPAYIYAILFMGISYFGIRHKIGNIGHDAHLGGAIIGLLIATVLHPWIIRLNPLLYAVVMSLAVVLFILLYVHSLDLHEKRAFGLTRLQEKISEMRDKREQQNQQQDDATVERLLQKISDSGMNSLTRRERKKLREISGRRKSGNS
ncbi:MAG TPA: rhomboid family intramembrane serine protease [Sedimentisphaerales bacterium]|nr:rhomboid family intramembrane serine protease [Sedimentisphaerales bacterium]